MSNDTDSEVSEALQSVTRGVGAQFFGMGAQKGIAFITNILLTNSLGTTLFGVYSLGNTLMSIAATLANLGTDQSIIRFIPQYEDQTSQNRVIGLAGLTSLVASLVVAAALYVAAPTLTKWTLSDQPLLTDVLRVFALFLPFQTLTGCVASVFRGMELPGYQVLTSSVAFQVFRLVTVGGAVVLGAYVIGTVAAILAATILTFLFAVGLFRRRTDFHPRIKGSEPGLFEFYNFSVPLTLQDVGSLFQNKPDILMVGFFLSGRAVGVYNIASLVSQTLTLPLVGFNTMFPPIAARMYSNGNIDDLETFFTRVTRWSFTLSLLPSTVFILYPSEVMSIFGPDFTAGSGVLSLFVVAQLTNAFVGPSGYVIMMTDHQYVMMVNEWGVGLLNIVLNYFFITQFGLIGAALATAGVLALVNLIRIVEVWYLEGLFPYSMKYYKPVSAGLLAAGVMWVMRFVLPISGFALLVVGGVTGGIVFVAVLVGTGIETEDREFFRELVGSRE